MSSLQEQARALGDPTRHRIFRDLAGADRALTVAELVARHHLGHSALRQHLAVLVQAGLVEGSTAEPAGPGRPHLLFRASPEADSRWGVVGPYERLSRLLAEVVRTGRSPREVGRVEGHRRAAGLVDDDPVARVRDALAAEGFRPEVDEAGDPTTVLLRRCPFEATAITDPATICALHLGMVEGIVGDAASVGEVVLDPRDPRFDSCSVRFRLRT